MLFALIGGDCCILTSLEGKWVYLDGRLNTAHFFSLAAIVQNLALKSQAHVLVCQSEKAVRNFSGLVDKAASTLSLIGLLHLELLCFR